MQVSSRIEHVVVLMLENRSFDHLFGYYPGVNGLKGEEFNLLNPFQPVSDSNPRFMVGEAAPWQITQGQGPGHSLNASNIQQSGSKGGPSAANPGRNNGFVMSYQEALQSDRVGNPDNATLGIPMQSFQPGQLPALTALAQEFVLCDNWFSEVPGPTQPNRLYVHAATSQGYAHNVWQNVFDCRTIYNQLQDAGKSWSVYYADDNDVAKFSQLSARAYTTPDEAKSWAADQQGGALGAYFDFQTFFASHAANGTLANYVFIEPAFGDSGKTKGAVNSMHPPSDLRPGDRLVADVYAALRANEALWAKTLFIVTFDEHGGFYDHVSPPAAVNPDGRNSPPPGDQSYAPTFGFDRLGLRVPTILASPWLAKGAIDSTQYQHTSILATVRDIFGISEGPLTKRDAAANSFTALLNKLPAVRGDTVASLPATPVPAVPPSDEPSHPANLAPDELLQEKTAAWHQLVQDLPDGKASPLQLPQTSRDAHDFIKDSVKRYANMKADGQPKFRVAQDGAGYRWQLHHGGNQVAQSSQLYGSREQAVMAARSMRGLTRHASFS